MANPEEYAQALINRNRQLGSMVKQNTGWLGRVLAPATAAIRKAKKKYQARSF